MAKIPDSHVISGVSGFVGFKFWRIVENPLTFRNFPFVHSAFRSEDIRVYRPMSSQKNTRQ